MYNKIPNDNKKVILIRNSTNSTNVLSDSEKGWREFFKSILKTSPRDSSHFLTKIDGTVKDPMKDTTVNSNVSLLMEDQLRDLSTNNEYDNVMESLNSGLTGFKNKHSSSEDGGILNMIKKATNLANTLIQGADQFVSDKWGDDFSTNRSLMPWFTNIKAWKNDSINIEFKYTFNFTMGQYGLWNAREEVLLPILNLISPTLTRWIGDLSQNGPFPTTAAMVASALFGEKADTGFTIDIFEVLSKKILNAYNNYSYSIKFGNFLTFNKVIIENSSWVFSNETDQFGYPVSGSVTLTFSSIVPLAISAEYSELMAIKLGL